MQLRQAAAEEGRRQVTSLVELAKAARQEEKPKSRQASAGALGGAGAAIAGGGLIASGVPGAGAPMDAKRFGQVQRRVMSGRGKPTAREMWDLGKKGILGFRDQAHRDFMLRQAKSNARQGREMASAIKEGRRYIDPAEKFMFGRASGKVLPEVAVRGQMKGLRRAGTAGLVAGAGLMGLSAIRRRRDPMERDTDPVRRQAGRRVGLGAGWAATAAGAGYGLNRVGRGWDAKAAEAKAAAQRLSPEAKTGRSTAQIADVLRDKNYHLNAFQAGVKRGNAAQYKHFANAYKMNGRGLMAAALLGVGGAVGGLRTLSNTRRVDAKVPARPRR